MADLSTISANNPAGTETPTLGDNRIRALADAVINSFFVEHALAGEHKVGIGALASRPAAGHAGRFWILTETGLSADLQYDTGAAWVTLTSLNTIGTYATNLATHQASNPIDHAAQSITHVAIKSGDIRVKHFVAGSSDGASAANLVNGGNADALHIHTAVSLGAQQVVEYTECNGTGAWTEMVCPAGYVQTGFSVQFGSGACGRMVNAVRMYYREIS